MVNKNTTNSPNKESDDKKNVIVKMCATMDDLYRQNQILEDNILHIQQHQLETNAMDELEVLVP